MKPKHAYIRPLHPEGGGRLKGLVLARTDGPIQVDEQIIEHFPADTPGVEIKAMAVEFEHADCVEHVHWASPIYAGD